MQYIYNKQKSSQWLQKKAFVNEINFKKIYVAWNIKVMRQR